MTDLELLDELLLDTIVEQEGEQFAALYQEALTTHSALETADRQSA